MRNFLITHPAFFRASFVVAFIVTLGLFVAGFVLPPRGDISPSVLKAGAILLAFAVVGAMPDIIRSGKSVTLRHGDTEATFVANNEKQPAPAENGNDQ